MYKVYIYDAELEQIFEVFNKKMYPFIENFNEKTLLQRVPRHRYISTFIHIGIQITIYTYMIFRFVKKFYKMRLCLLLWLSSLYVGKAVIMF